MKIVTIWNTYGPYHLARVRAIERTFPDAEVVCFSHCAESDVYQFFNLQPKQHKVLVQKRSDALGFFESLVATLRALRAERPDLVLTCGYERPETLACVLWRAVAPGAMVVLMLDNQYDDSPRSRLTETVKRFYLRFFDGFIYGGDTHKNYLRRLGVPPNREMFGYNCVDNDAIATGVAAARHAGVREFQGGDYFLCVARLIPKKNLPRLVRAYAAYAAQVPIGERPWSLVICGDGPERSSIEAIIRECGVTGQVVLAGRVDDFNRVINYYTFARALLLVSHENEQWGLVVNEAMASGLPVIVARQCGCASSLVKDRENGFAFDGNSTEQITEHMSWMHRHADELPRMGERSREIIQGYSPDNFALNVKHLRGMRQSQFWKRVLGLA